MLKKAIIGVVCALVGGAALYAAQDMPHQVEAKKEHKWLHQFVGEWKSVCELSMGPDTPMVECEGSESVRALGDLWIVSEVKGTPPGGEPMTAILTIGYDPAKGKFVGTWIDSMTAFLWHYEGWLDETGKILTLESEGPNFSVPGTTAKYRDVTEFKSKDHRYFTSSMLGEDGKWHTFMKGNYHRVK